LALPAPSAAAACTTRIAISTLLPYDDKALRVVKRLGLSML
jgi:hypothetical protein